MRAYNILPETITDIFYPQSSHPQSEKLCYDSSAFIMDKAVPENRVTSH
jgi:hypothetical protein